MEQPYVISYVMEKCVQRYHNIVHSAFVRYFTHFYNLFNGSVTLYHDMLSDELPTYYIIYNQNYVPEWQLQKAIPKEWRDLERLHLIKIDIRTYKKHHALVN